MSRDRSNAAAPSPRALNRLLEALAEPDACAARSEFDATLIVRAARNGITMVRARVAAGIGDAAVSAGLAAWSPDARLRITAAGRAWLRRAGAPEAADPFRAQHAEYERRAPEKGAPPVLINNAESPLGWLARRKDRTGKPFLDPTQVEAGERLRRDLERAQLLQRVTATWEAPTAASRRGADAGVAVSDIAIDARRRLDRVFDALGPELASLLIDVCGYLKGMEKVERERGWPVRSAKLIVRLALERLASHYGIGIEATGPARAKGLTHWGAEDYRPRM